MSIVMCMWSIFNLTAFLLRVTETQWQTSSSFAYHFTFIWRLSYIIPFSIITLLLTLRGGNFWDMFKISSWKNKSSDTASMVTSSTVTISSNSTSSSSSTGSNTDSTTTASSTDDE